MDLEFSGEVFFWKGPAPWYFVTVPEAESDAIADVSAMASYGWGCIPVTARLGDTSWRTSLFPKDGKYLVPLKTSVRKAAAVDLGDVVSVRLTVDV
ncbi:MAG: hypothetical protein QOD07_1024 [Frankiaceae bacterium]|nr:hypothetical protein [Frankiaceae bacterium]